MLGQISTSDTVTVNLLPATGQTGAFTPTNLTLISKAPTNVLSLGNANSISVVKSGTVNLDATDSPTVVSGNALTGPFVLNFMFNTDRGAASSNTDGGPTTPFSHGVEFAVGLVTHVSGRDTYDGKSGFLYGMVVNTTAAAAGGSSIANAAATVYCKGEAAVNTGSGPVVGPTNAGSSSGVSYWFGPTLPLANANLAIIPKGGNHSLQIRFDGANLSYYVDGVLLRPSVAPPVAGTTCQVQASNRERFYLVMNFGNGSQFSSIPVGQRVPPTNFTIQVTMSEIFGGANNLLGTTLTHLQTFNTTYAMTTSAPAAVIGTYATFVLDTVNSSAFAPEVVYTTANGQFRYTATDNVSRAMINLTINVSAAGAFNMRYLVFNSSSALRITGPTIPASGATTVWGLTMKVSFILNTGDIFILQAWAPLGATPFLSGSTVVVEKLPVAQGGGGQPDHRWVNVHVCF